MKDQGWRAIGTQYRKASDILTSTLAAFFLQPPNNGKGSRDSWTPVLEDPGTRAHELGSSPNDRRTEWRTSGMADPRNGGPPEWRADLRNGGPPEWRPPEWQADLRNGGPPEWRPPGMAGPPLSADVYLLTAPMLISSTFCQSSKLNVRLWWFYQLSTDVTVTDDYRRRLNCFL